MHKALKSDEIRALGVEAIRAFTEAGNTLVTNQEGVETLKELDQEALAKEFATQLMTKLAKIKVKRPHKKYPSNYTPSPKRHRKAKTKY